MEEGEIGSDISNLSGGEEENSCFNDDVNAFIDVENSDKVDEGQENSFSMDNTHINGVRGAGFVDTKGRFFQTNNKRKGNGAVDGGSFLSNVDVTENKCNPVMPSAIMEDGCDVQGDSPYLVDNVEGEGEAESPSQPPDYRRDQSSTSHGSSKILKKKVLVVVDDIKDVLNQYFEMDGLLGYDMETNKERVKKILSSIVVV
ncbi:unnamed protein product [Lactuca saligna]|uniref:Uncharacterized protein n=1 Tax=Lactuca saligna TaxID=75948 RepID=A0AA35ZA02_LACSI|nr:unnamed protein product [Lactuca saligna]